MTGQFQSPYTLVQASRWVRRICCRSLITKAIWVCQIVDVRYGLVTDRCCSLVCSCEEVTFAQVYRRPYSRVRLGQNEERKICSRTNSAFHCICSSVSSSLQARVQEWRQEVIFREKQSRDECLHFASGTCRDRSRQKEEEKARAVNLNLPFI